MLFIWLLEVVDGDRLFWFYFFFWRIILKFIGENKLMGYENEWEIKEFFFYDYLKSI